MLVYSCRTHSGYTKHFRARMNSCGKKQFISIDVAHSSDERLVQQYSLDSSAAFSQTGIEGFEINIESVRPFPRQSVWQDGIEFEASELAHVIKIQRAAVEIDDGAGIFPGFRIP